MPNYNEHYVGRRVRCVNDEYGGVDVGDLGTVVALNTNGMLGVRWDEYRYERHDLGGECEDGHGWYMFSNCIEFFSDDLGEIEPVSQDSVAELLGW